MRTVLQQMGDSVGFIIPKSILDELGSVAGSNFELSVQNGRLVADPGESDPRAGWAEAAKQISEAGDNQLVWPEFHNGDVQLTW